MKTTPLYLTDPYLKTTSAIILEAFEEKEGVYKLILDKTIFYPMGGGQPTDQGFITFSDGKQSEVYQILFKDDEIYHYAKCSFKPISGQSIDLNLDWDRRFKNMKIHSGGHVVDFALYLLGKVPHSLYPVKGDHGKKPFIVYAGTLNEDIKDELQEKINMLIANDLKFSWSFELLENLEKDALYLQTGLPKNKPLRALHLESVGTVADGGTIVKQTSEIGPVSVTHIESLSNETRIHYKLG